MKICLHLNLEQNKKIPSESTKGGLEYRLYENEAIRCVEAWRKNAGWLADVDVYGVASRKSIPSKKTLSKLEALGVKLLWDDRVWTKTFLNTVYSQLDFENGCYGKYDFVVHTDLDLYAKTQLPEDFFKLNQTAMVLYGPDARSGSQELCYRYENVRRCHDTLFVVNFPGSGLFKTVADLVQDASFDAWWREKALYNNDWYFFEESLFDYADEKDLWKGFERKYLVEDELNGRWFEHRHLAFRDLVEEKMKRGN